MSNLIRYELTEEGKALAAAGKSIVLPANGKGDRHFSCLASQLADYHAEQILKRQDGKGARYVKAKQASKKPPKGE